MGGRSSEQNHSILWLYSLSWNKGASWNNTLKTQTPSTQASGPDQHQDAQYRKDIPGVIAVSAKMQINDLAGVADLTVTKERLPKSPERPYLWPSGAEKLKKSRVFYATAVDYQLFTPRLKVTTRITKSITRLSGSAKNTIWM